VTTPGRDRTCDLRFRKPSLYPLSYGGGCGFPRKNKGFRFGIVRKKEGGTQGFPKCSPNSGRQELASGALTGRVSPSSSPCPRADPVEPTTTPPDLLRSFRRSLPIRCPVRSSASPRQPTWRHRATANSNAGTVRSRARSSGTRPYATSRKPAASSATSSPTTTRFGYTAVTLTGAA
jgi:hypothetical protein